MSFLVVTLQNSFGKYFSAPQGSPIVATIKTISSTECFESYQDGNTVYLIAANKKYVTLQDDGQLQASSDTRTPKAAFVFNKTNNKITLQAHNGKFVSSRDQSGKVVADAESAGPTETFFFKNDKKNPCFFRRTSDVAIIGGGITGAYMAYRLLAENPDLTVTIFEARNRVSGRLLSYPSKDPKVEDELGGMRIFPDTQKVVAKLLTHLNMTYEKSEEHPKGNGAIQIRPLDDTYNYFYAQGKQYVKKDFRVTRGGKPLSLGEIDKDAWNNFINSPQCDLPDGKKQQAFAWESKSLGEMSHDEFYRKYGFNRQELDLFKAWSGYDLYPESVSAAGYHAHAVLYGSAISNQKFLRDGYGIICRALIAALEDKSNFSIKMSTKVTSVQINDPNALPKDRQLTLLVDEEAEPYRAKHVIITTTLKDTKEIQLYALPKARISALDGIVSLPLFKIFLLYSDAWWLKKDENPAKTCTGGKSTTDLPIRQIHYYGENTLLIYNSGTYGTYWHQRFSQNVDRALSEVLEQVLEVHGLTQLPEGVQLERFRYKYWPSGSHKWARGTDFAKQLENIQVGHDYKEERPSHNNVYFAGDTYSLEQGWVEGALTSAENVLTKAFGLKDWDKVTDDEIWKVFPVIDLGNGMLAGSDTERYYKNQPSFSNTVTTKPLLIQSQGGEPSSAQDNFNNNNLFKFSSAEGTLSFENTDSRTIDYIMLRTQNENASPYVFSIESTVKDDNTGWTELYKYELTRPTTWSVFKITELGRAKYLRIKILSNYGENHTEIDHVSFHEEEH